MISALQVIDSLALGGSESVAVLLANKLAQNGVRSFLCATREGGPLESRISPGVSYTCLQRKGRFDLSAIRRLAALLREQRIQVVHAHSTSLFISALACFLTPATRLVWHIHAGRASEAGFQEIAYRFIVSKVDGVFAVNENLVSWARRSLGVREDRVWYLPNCPAEAAQSDGLLPLPGLPGSRIICVANLRPEKDHLTLLEAFRLVVAHKPEATLFLVGSCVENGYSAKVRNRITDLHLTQNVYLLGSRPDATRLMQACDVGVLSSSSEGLPLSLLEYGVAGLPVVGTDVGQVRKVLGEGRLGNLVPPRDPSKLGEALLGVLGDTANSARMAKEFQSHVAQCFSSDAMVAKVLSAYRTVLGNGATLKEIHEGY